MTESQLHLGGGNAAYLPSLSVPGAEGFFDQWARNSQHARGRVEPQVLAYGESPTELIDVFDARSPRGTVVFIHGGYWSQLGRRDFSYMAPELVTDKWRVAMVDYDLCPTVTLGHIVDQVRRALVALTQEYDDGLIVTGHSAGGHLAAMAHATDWSAYAATPQILTGIGMSGLYELDPLRETAVQDDVRLDDADVATLSPARLQPTSGAPFHLVVGENESEAFHAQSEALHRAWPTVALPPRDLPGHNHFTIIDELARLVEDAATDL